MSSFGVLPGSFLNGPDTVLARIAARQYGLVRTVDLREAGLSSSAVSKRARRGTLHRVYHGVYALGHTALSREGWLLATVFAAGEGAMLCGDAAAEHWGISRFRNAPITVLSPRQVRVAGVRARRTGRLDPRDATVHRGIPVTTVARTIVDLTERRTVGQVVNVMYEAAFHGLLDLHAIEATALRLPGRTRPHALDDALAAYRSGSAGTRSGKEDTFHAIVAPHLPRPLTNVKVLGEEVDAYWPEYRLIAEVDGPGHERPRARRRDRARDRVLTAAGFIVLRFSSTDVDHHPSRVLAALRNAIAARAAP